jgi:4'-phosphopantetheinyl transferase
VRPSLTDNEVHLWLVDLADVAAVPDGVLTGAELERRERLRDPAAGRRWASSRWALREVLGRYLDQAPGEIELTLGEHGKPELAAPAADLRFNLSHSADLALIAVAGAAVGVDVEWIDPDRDFVALARRALGAEDVRAITASPPQLRAAAFYAAWTAHEARLKCDGGGFGGPPPPRELTAVSVDVGGGYAAAYAVADRRPRERRYRLDLR